MKILLVEDDDVKRNRVSAFLTEHVPGMDLEVVRSLQSGLRMVRAKSYELIILDMTLPNYDPGPHEPGGKPQIFGGREFLRQMDRFEINTPVIVVTQFAAFGRGSSLVNLEDLDKELKEEHGNIYKGAIYYNSAIQGWMDELRRLLDVVLKESKG
jgi:CheY-like chemotaxis protein